MASVKNVVADILSQADIRINGRRAWDIKVIDDRLYARVFAGGSLALGESYMDGWWDCQGLDKMFDRLLGARLDKNVRVTPRVAWLFVKSLLNLQTRKFARQNIEHHYDIGNDLYEAMLDPTMTYSCAYWKDAKTLEEAQEAKYDLICRKMGLEKGMRVLDIGCGWGGFVEFATREYGAKVVGITLSKEQADWAKKHSRNVLIQDYRDVTGRFDRIVSIGMFEHVGVKNYNVFFKKSRELLKEDGLLLLHTIGRNNTSTTTDPWIGTYIFPNSMLPSPLQITRSIEGLFVLEDWHNFGADYDKTLMAWHENFKKAWPDLKNTYDEQFYRMWEYYLLSCAGSFRCRKNQLWQLVLSPEGVERGYERVI